jgi:UDP-N-acetylmuramoyl-tripeptide--D-alanyl-D-alanine ligase
MKSKKIYFLEKILRLMAICVLKRHKPKIVAITGSVGKTSAKTAVFAVLSSRFKVRENQKNYNNEIGLPLTIIGSESGGSSMLGWFLVGLKWLFTIIYPKYPEILVLELGIDRPGDMKYFMSFIHPWVGIITNVSTSHMEFFGSVDNIAKEKRKLLEFLPSQGYAILNADDEKVAPMAEKTKANVMTIGTEEKYFLSASNISFNYEGDVPDGISFKLNYDGKNVPIRLRNMLAAHSIYSAMIGAAAGIVFKMNLVEIGKALESVRSPQGRMNLFEGINGSYVIDDTYNASPISTISAIQTLKEIRSKRKIAILGDMLELGDGMERGHREVGKSLKECGVDILIAVGTRMKFAADELISSEFPAQNIFRYGTPDEAAKKAIEIIKSGDSVLVKGSQGMRMEKVVEKIVADFAKTKNLMCRQSEQWRKKPFIKP